jgi:hypothetical protein
MNVKYLIEANKKLCLDNAKNIVFVFCAPKVGSTSLVSSLRLYASSKYNIIHVHGNHMIKMLYGISEVTINDIIVYNATILKKSVFVIDIFRTPIEQKISMFFEEIAYHFNTTEEDVCKFKIETLCNRFSNVFPHLSNNSDYFKNFYDIAELVPSQFDFDKKYMLVEKQGIKFIKLRLCDADNYWNEILQKLLNVSNLKIIKDYTSDSKIFKETFLQFKKEYIIPANLFEEYVENNTDLNFYFNESEKINYLSLWKDKTKREKYGYTLDEYKLYMNICNENKTIYDKLQKNHYIDQGCTCKTCSSKRLQIVNNIALGKLPSENIKHTPILKQQPVIVYYKYPKKRFKKLNMLKNS